MPTNDPTYEIITTSCPYTMSLLPAPLPIQDENPDFEQTSLVDLGKDLSWFYIILAIIIIIIIFAVICSYTDCSYLLMSLAT